MCNSQLQSEHQAAYSVSHKLNVVKECVGHTGFKKTLLEQFYQNHLGEDGKRVWK